MTNISADDAAMGESEKYGATESATSAPSFTYINEAGVPESVIAELRNSSEIASAVEQWSQQLRAKANGASSVDVFGREKWNNERHAFSQMSLCAWAVENDDILSTLADVTEGLMFNRCGFNLNDDDQQDVWNQWAATIDLDSRLREMARELYKVSQVYVGIWWSTQTYTVRDQPIREAARQMEAINEARKTAGQKGGIPKLTDLPGPGRGNRARRKTFELTVPTGLTIFDPTKVFPVQTLMFSRERFAYIATKSEDDAFGPILEGRVSDPMVMRLIEKKYDPTPEEKTECEKLGIDPTKLWLFRQDAMFRHTLTRAQYERFAAVRLRPALALLDMKDHLRAADRAALMGNANFIVVITKGSDKLPAKPAEIENLQEQARVVARLPVLVGDHRLNVEIVSPPLENTLQDTRWQTLDSRLVFVALRTFAPVMQGGNASGAGVSEMSRVVSQGLENRRHQLVRSLEQHVFDLIMNRNPELTEFPALEFRPKRISLEVLIDELNALLKVRDRGDISRETMLEELGFDEDVEALRRVREKALYDGIFDSGVPYASPDTQPNAAPGAPKEAGRPAGSKDTKPRTSKDAPSA